MKNKNRKKITYLAIALIGIPYFYNPISVSAVASLESSSTNSLAESSTESSTESTNPSKNIKSSSSEVESTDSTVSNEEISSSSTKESFEKTNSTKESSNNKSEKSSESIVNSKALAAPQGDPYNFFGKHFASTNGESTPDLSSLDWQYYQEREASFGDVKMYYMNDSLEYKWTNEYRVYGKLTGEFELPNGIVGNFDVFSIPKSDYTADNWDSTYFDGTNSGEAVVFPIYYPDYNKNYDGTKVSMDIGEDMHVINKAGDILASTQTSHSYFLAPGTSKLFANWSTVKDIYGSSYSMEYSVSFLNNDNIGPEIYLSDSMKNNEYYQGDDISNKLGDLRGLFDNPDVAENLTWEIKPSSDQLGQAHGVILATGSNGRRTYINYVYNVKENKTAVNVHDSTIYGGIGGTTTIWSPKDNFDNAVSANGTKLTYDEFIAQGGIVDDSKFDKSQPGTYQVDYTLNGVTSTANITVKKNKTAVNVHDSTIYVGDAWKAEDNFDSALDKDGNPVDFSKLTVDDSQVDTSKAGTYEVTYTYDGVTSKATVTVKEKQTAVNVHNSTIYVGDSWKAEDNFDSALDKDGNDVAFSDITVDDSQVDTSKAGTYEVAYTYDGVTSKATVTVKEKQTAVNVHNSTIYVGDSWKAKDNFDSALDKDGNKVDFADLTVDDSQVDTSKAGTYEVTYTYDGVTSKATVTVKEKQTAVNVHDSTIYVGDSWKAEDNFDSALDKDGNKVDFANLTVDDSQADTSKAGQFDVTYTYGGVTSTATVTVKEKQTAVNVHDSTIYVGDSWKAEDNFDSALDKDGNDVAFSDITVDDSQVDTSKAGTYEVTYTYDGVTSIATVTVKEKQTAVNVHNSTIYVGDNWKAEDNFDSALDKDGNPVDLAKLTVDDSQVDTSKAGTYEVTYTYDGVTSKATVTVKEKQTAVNVHNSTIYVGDNWKAEDNFDSALDKDGNPVDLAKLTVDDSQVDTSKAGTYEVTYTYDGVTSKATVTVKEKQTAVNVHDSTIYIGDNWKAEDNFDSALDKDGNDVAFLDITVDDSKVDTSKAGTYEVTYTYDGVTSKATVTVKEKQTAVNVHDSTIYVGDSWKAEDNFDSALDKDGNDVAFSDITVDDSQVDTSKAGTYEVIYTYDGVTSKATVTVKEKQTAVNVHNSTIYVGDNWKAEDNFDSALDKDGNIVDFADLTVDDSQVDTSKAGTYEVTYRYDGVTSKAIVTVRAKELPNNKSTVVVQYVDENGNKISKDTVLTGKAGDDYHTKAKNIKGYELTKTPKNKDGKFKKESITVTYLYKERNAEEADIDQSGNSSTEHGKSSRKGHTEESRQQDTLPKTGEKSSVPEVILGAGILLLVGIGFFWRTRKIKE
jgi:LPXTG-motif cell wall-anchored protein